MHVATNSHRWPQYVIPLLAWIFFGLAETLHQAWLHVLLVPLLIACVLQAVHHAEIVALRIGQPFGSLILALCVTGIEVSLIVSMMLASGPEGANLARDTVLASVMIILNGMVGLSIFAGGIRHQEQRFVLQGVNTTLVPLLAIAVLTLILPNFTVSQPGPYYSTNQLLFVAVVTLIIYGSFLFVQNFRHKEYFLSEEEMTADEHLTKPGRKLSLISLVLLLVNLGAVIMLAEALAPDLEEILDAHGLPRTLVGIVIACVVLLPEGLSAYKAARNNQLQTSLNLSLGSALASIGLSIPIISFVAYFTGFPLALGISHESTVLLLLSMFIIMTSLNTGRTSIMHGIVLLVVFLVYLYFSIFP